MIKKGFTLLEVLIVVIIIGLLAAIALPQYMATLKKAKAGEAYTNLGTLRSSMDRYYYDQISSGAYTQLSGAAWVDSLDVEIDDTDWTYTLDDGGATSVRNYVITATKADDSDIWVKIDENGTMTKCTILGGSGTQASP